MKRFLAVATLALAGCGGAEEMSPKEKYDACVNAFDYYVVQIGCTTELGGSTPNEAMILAGFSCEKTYLNDMSSPEDVCYSKCGDVLDDFIKCVDENFTCACYSESYLYVSCLRNCY